MKRFLIAAVTCLALIVGVSPAAADSGVGGLLDTVSQTVQRNTNTAGEATASNDNATGQSNDQAQLGTGGDATTGDATADGGDATSGAAYGGDVMQTQSASNGNATAQNAEAVSEAQQIEPVNVNVPVCIANYCETGDIEQTNANSSGDATASNENTTKQSNDQFQHGTGGDASTGDATTGGHGCCGSGDATSGDAKGGDVTQSQDASNTNETSQNATAKSEAKQVAPVNVNAPVCIARACKSGDVDQRNENSAGDATASNENTTYQSNDQAQVGTGGDASTGDATARGGHGDATSGAAYGGDVDQSQSASNANSTTQDATAVSKAKQVPPVNVNLPICIAKQCETGDVRQSNVNRSGDATASNENTTKQSNGQFQKRTGGDASTGDATTGRDCCKHGGYEAPKPKPGCDDSYGKSRCDHSAPCKPKSKRYDHAKPTSKPRHECKKHDGDARSGDAKGGDVDQTQGAWNDNRAGQTAYAGSIAEQVEPVNLALGWTPSKRSPDTCRPC